MLKLQHALLASLCLLPLAATEAMATTAGVTAAVNQNAKSTPPGGTVRTVVLGANVVQDETIETDGGGLVQILLADGTTFTVGPNSSITIDRFVYDPNANTAQVSATIGRGVFRFIGGRTSKTEGGVQLNTPVGTVGIRGGMADLNFTGAGGSVAQIDLLFGEEVTLDGPNGGDRIFQAGYSIVIGPNGQPTVVKTPPGSANFIQQALAGRPGANGGNSDQPDDDDVENSGVADTNSNDTPPADIPPPDLDAIDLATPKPTDINQVAQTLANGTLLVKKGFSSGIGLTQAPVGAVSAPLADFGGESQFVFRQDGKLAGAKFAFGLRQFANVVTMQPATVYLLTGNFPGAESLTADLPASPDLEATNVQTVVTRSNEKLVQCECLDWGYWYSDFDLTQAGEGGPETNSYELVGTWIAGDVMSPSQFDQYASANQHGTATYSGQARGYGQFLNGTDAAQAVREGSGTFTMNWNFGDRNGNFNLNNFSITDNVGTHSFTASTAISEGGMTSGYFTGGSGSPSGIDHFAVSGAFINNGTSPAAGVIGSFNGLDVIGSEYPDLLSVTGVFAGEQTGWTNPH